MARRKGLLKLALKERLYRRRFLLPNAVTLANMFCGFLAGIYAAQGQYQKGVIAIGFAILLDGLDGRVARRFNATSKFGLEFDSFSDLVSFGVAPALLMYHWCFKAGADEFGVFVTFVYVLCAANRLARFNITQQDLKTFVGLPTPGAAGLVAACINFAPQVEPNSALLVFCSFLMLALASLMVSKVEFLSVKLLRMRTLGLFARIILGGLIALIWYDAQIGFLVIAGGYCLSGPLNWLRSRAFGKRLISVEKGPPGEKENQLTSCSPDVAPNGALKSPYKPLH